MMREPSQIYVPQRRPISIVREVTTEDARRFRSERESRRALDRDAHRELDAHRRRRDLDAWLRRDPTDAWHMAPAIVGSLTATENSGSAGTLAAASITVGAGNGLVIFGTWGDTTGTVTCADNNGGTGLALDTAVDSTNGQTIKSFYILNHNSGATVVTITFSPNKTFRGVAVVEVSGVTVMAGSKANPQSAASGTDSITSTAITPSSQPGIIIACSLNSDGANGAPNVTTGFTSHGTCWNFSGSNDARVEYKAISSLTPVAATFTPASGTHAYITAAVILSQASAGVTYNAPFFGTDA